MVRGPSRRNVLAGAAAVAAGCGWPRQENRGQALAAILRAPNDPIAPLVAQLQQGATLEDIARAVTDVAITSCHSEAGNPLGMVSHAFLGVSPALALARQLPKVRAPIPVLCCAAFVAAEAKRSPYGPTPFALSDAAKPAHTNLDAALDALDVEAADRIVAHTPADQGLGLVRAAALRRFGHLGHGLLFVAGGVQLTELLSIPLSTTLRPAARYLASYAVPSAPVIPGNPDLGSVGRWLLGVKHVDMGVVHALTSSVALMAVPPPERPDWPRRFRAGQTELGEIAVRDAPITERKGTLDDLSRALAGSDGDSAAALTLTLHRDRTARALIVEHAIAGAQATFQHTTKATAAALLTSGPAFLAAAVRMVAGSAMDSKTIYPRVCAALELDPVST